MIMHIKRIFVGPNIAGEVVKCYGVLEYTKLFTDDKNHAGSWNFRFLGTIDEAPEHTPVYVEKEEKMYESRVEA